MSPAPIGRRALLAAGLSALGAAASAQAPLRPLARPAPAAGGLAAPPALRPPARAELAQLIAAAGLDGCVGLALVDVASGTLLAEHDAATPRPPASVAKAVTALYALDHLGLGHRFATRLLATGPVAEGALRGDLVLAGGGDPVLVTDRLAELARALAAQGVGRVEGRFLAWGGALPHVEEIAPEQLDFLGYNPAVAGLNLNFNRVHFEWARQGDDYRLTLEARGDTHRPAVATAQVTLVPGDGPVFRYQRGDGVDLWTVARGRLGEAGARWLPVRDPTLYAAQAFRGLAAEAGVALPEPEPVPALPRAAAELARLDSEPLEALLRDVLRWSTNLTAEVLGLAASQARGLAPAGLRDSARAMDDHIARTTGARMRHVDHSGLSADSRAAPAEMALMLARRGVMDRLRPHLRDIALTDAEGEPLALPPAILRAKTGTLHFVSTLAGYARTLGGRDLAFAIFAADLERRAEASRAQAEIPAGARAFSARARRLQQQLVQRWGRIG